MKKFMKYALLLVIGIAVGLSACLTTYYFTGSELFEKTVGRRGGVDTAAAAEDATNIELINYANVILGYIKEGDYLSLSKVVHPEYGVVFSPYATITLATDKYFTASQVASFAQDQNKYVWGKYDGSGEPIEMIPAEYIKKFVFDKDYTISPEIAVDTIIKSGNSLENIKEVFPDIRFVDFHIPGSEANDGIDWSSLRLGFEKYEGQLKLTVIVHSQWTV